MIASFGEDDVHDGAHMGAQRTAGGTKPVIIIIVRMGVRRVSSQQGACSCRKRSTKRTNESLSQPQSGYVAMQQLCRNLGTKSGQKRLSFK